MPLVLHTSSVTCVGNRYFFDSFFSNINNVVNITSDVLIKLLTGFYNPINIRYLICYITAYQ